LPAILLRN